MQYESFTDSGSRPINEDCHGTAMNGTSSCFVLADGLGGHGGGNVASQCAVDVVCQLFAEQGYSDHFFEDAFREAQAVVLEKQREAHARSQMKTTMVILVLHEGKSFYAHVGDSRMYLFRNGKFKLRTIDHSVPQMLVLQGQIKECEIRHHPDRNKLMRVIGIKDDPPRYEVGKPVKNSGRQAFLLCTDGYWELIDEATMSELLRKSETPEQWIAQMNDVIRQNGKDTDMDNFTAIAVFEKTKGLFS